MRSRGWARARLSFRSSCSSPRGLVNSSATRSSAAVRRSPRTCARSLSGRRGCSDSCTADSASSTDLSMTMPEKVGFLVVGAQKSGTSALDEYLRHHPELCLPSQKEVHFFDADELFVTDAVDYARYHANFKPQPQHRLMGEVTPSYLY